MIIKIYLIHLELKKQIVIISCDMEQTVLEYKLFNLAI